VTLQACPGKSRALCLDNGPVDTCVDPDTAPRPSSRPFFTLPAYGALPDRLRGFANGNAARVIA